MTTVACRQLAPTLGDLAVNHARVVEAIDGASARGADVLVLPELATSAMPSNRSPNSRDAP
jgi:5-aminopentanamidase